MSGSLTGLVSHTRRVQRLYKQALRSLEDHFDRREVFRYQAVLMRQRFEENRDVKDMRIARELLENGEEEVFQKKHFQPKKFAMSPGGVAFAREVAPPDWVVDYWHPLEKAEYPEYFARREERKKEYIKLWEKKYGKAEPEPVAMSPGGVAFAREVAPPDWVVDYWHPLEKAEYPEYFARREERKKEYIKLWEKKYGKAEPEPGHH